MNFFWLLVTLICTFSLFTFIVLFGHVPVLKHTPVGWTHHILLVSLPRWIGALDQRLAGGKMTRQVSKTKNRLMNERHPTVLIFYLVLFSGSVFIYTTRVLPSLPKAHWVAVPGLIVLPLTTLYLAATTDPGYITARTHSHYMEKYRYDGVLFRKGHECSTCLREKPARSKHCGLCNHCIAKHDHHCIWINSCVGEKNMKWFLAFLLTNMITFTYATITLFSVLRDLRRDYHLSREQSVSFELSGPQLYLQLLRSDVLRGSLFLFVTLCDLMVTAFLVYHLYLVFSGVTTNETLKFEDVRTAIQSGDLSLYSKRPGEFVLNIAGEANEVSWDDLENVYDEGWRQNLFSILQE